MDRIHCDICRRAHNGQKLPFLCVVDARNRLYEGRVQNAASLMQNEDLEKQVDAVLSSRRDNNERAALSTKARVESWKSEQARAVDRTSQIIAQADQLKAEVDAARKEIKNRKDGITRRRSDLASVSDGIASRRSRQVEDIERSMQMSKYKWNRSADAMAATRAFLCEEAARLYGLRQVRKGNSKRYEIGGVEIIELHAMNGLSPEVISTSLAHIAHILMMASHYLSIRLPAEITLPHRDYPRPTIFSLSASYRHGEVAFPGSTLPQHLSSDARGAGNEHTPRPRPLFVDKSLPTLAKEDPPTYALFLEGVTLLAYDIAWLCSTQGVSIGDRNSFDDVCNIGQNLWRLFIGDQLIRKSMEPAFPNSLTPPVGSPKDDGPPKAQIGRWSHGTTHSFLAGAEGSEFVRSFKLLAPIKLTDRLKKKLSASNDTPMIEWENIDGEEARAGDEDADQSGNRRGGITGWTKLKNRGN